MTKAQKKAREYHSKERVEWVKSLNSVTGQACCYNIDLAQKAAETQAAWQEHQRKTA